MEYYLLIARSITYAQRMQRALRQAGIPSGILRAPAQVNPKGCSHAVRIGPEDLARVQNVLSAAKLQPNHIYAKTQQGYEEVAS